MRLLFLVLPQERDMHDMCVQRRISRCQQKAEAASYFVKLERTRHNIAQSALAFIAAITAAFASCAHNSIARNRLIHD